MDLPFRRAAEESLADTMGGGRDDTSRLEAGVVVVAITGAELEGDAVRVRGEIDGAEYTAQVWLSHLESLADKAAQQKYCAQQLAAAAGRDQPKRTIDLVGTVTI